MAILCINLNYFSSHFRTIVSWRKNGKGYRNFGQRKTARESQCVRNSYQAQFQLSYCITQRFTEVFRSNNVYCNAKTKYLFLWLLRLTKVIIISLKFAYCFHVIWAPLLNRTPLIENSNRTPFKNLDSDQNLVKLWQNLNWTPTKNPFWKIEPRGCNCADTVDITI